MTCKVLVQINSVGIRGSELNSVDLAAAVRPHGYECILIAPRDTAVGGPSLFDAAKVRGVPIELYERPPTTRRGAADLSAIVARHRADLVHVYGSWSSRPAYWGPCLLGRRPLVKTVYEMKVNADTVGVGQELVIGTQQLLGEITGRRGGVHLVSPPVDLTRDAPGAVDPGPFMSSVGIEPARPRVVLVSRLDKDLKGLSARSAILSAERIAGTGMQLIVVGGGDSEQSLRRLADGVNTSAGRKVVVMTGPMSDPRPAYSCADIVIGMAGSASRGLAFGKPLVVSGEFGWFRTFTPENASRLFALGLWSTDRSPDPLGELTACLEALLSDHKERSRLAAFGREFARHHFGLEEMGAKMAAIYDAAIAAYGLGPWLADIPLECGFVWRKLTGRPGYRPLYLHEPPPTAGRPA